MKKPIIAFISFCVAFLGALGLISSNANPTVSITRSHTSLEWNGHVENEYGTYNGAMIDDLFSGYGDFAFLTGELYSGEWDNSYMSGNGKVVFPGIGVYEGEMAESKREGKGSFEWETGEKYEGSWQNDAMNGQGKYYFLDGRIFDGVFESNTPCSGILSFAASSTEDLKDTDIIEYKYSFSENEQKLMFVTKNGLKYDGTLSGLSEKGTATITYPSGNKYTGDISSGQRSGTGTYTWVDAKGIITAYYEGKWVDDHMNGQGKYHYSSAEYPYLTGNFENDLPDGVLTYYKAAGNTFETTWNKGNCTKVRET